MRRLRLDSPLCLCVRKLGASLFYRLGAEAWFNPGAAVISYPKSGRTWIRVMLHAAGIRGIPFSHAGSSEEGRLTAEAFTSGLRSWNGTRILLLIRDPRDTVVSFYFQAKLRSRVYAGEFRPFLRDPRFGIERVLRFNLLWLEEHRRFPAFGVVSYEDFHADPCAGLRTASLFLTGQKPPEADLRRAVHLGSFGMLRQLELSGAGARQWGVRLSPGDYADPESFKTRRGVVGGWRDYFTAEDEAYAADLLHRHDYFQRAERVRQAVDAGGWALNRTPPPARYDLQARI